jgi:hypothetical protein
MTVLVLAQHAGELARCADWLADSGEPLVGLTGELPRTAEPTGYARIEEVPGYAGSTAVELTAVRIAREVQLSAIVATGFPDLLRAACLREYLGVPGMDRTAALACVDLAVLRDHLQRSGVPVVPARPVRRAADVCWHSRTLGLPLRLRHRRAPGWAATARIADQHELAAALEREPEGGWATLLAEPDLPGLRERIWLTGPSTDRGEPVSEAEDGREWIASAVRNALPGTDGLLLGVDALTSTDGRLLVDTLVLAAAGTDDPELRRAVRAQAGLRDKEPVSWPS